MKASVAEFIKQLPQPSNEKYPEGVPFIKAFEAGAMSLELFAPQGDDRQTPHEQDELYVIISGTGDLIRNNERINFTAGDVIYVPAGMRHHFENFSSDFMTWVIFYGEKVSLPN